jgi:hypothetical protein
MYGSPSSGVPLAEKKLGKEVGSPSFAEVVYSASTISVMGGYETYSLAFLDLNI